MKETGVVRRLDELGRIVIPKEIRRRLKIENSDLVDIFTDEDRIILKKYYPLDHDIKVVASFLDCIKKSYGSDIVLADKTKIIYNTFNSDLNGEELDSSLLNRIESYLNKEISSLVKLNLTKSKVIDRDVIIYKVNIEQEHYGYLFIMDGMISKRQKDLGILILNYFAHIL